MALLPAAAGLLLTIAGAAARTDTTEAEKLTEAQWALRHMKQVRALRDQQAGITMMECVGAEEWEASNGIGLGGCSTYAPGMLNNNACFVHFHEVRQVFAYQACQECGSCTGPATPLPATPPPVGEEPAAPSGGGGSGCGGGCAFLIIFFVGGFVYMAAGFAYNMKVKQLPAGDAVPHAAFFRDLPLLIKDGVLYGYNKVRGREGYTAT